MRLIRKLLVLLFVRRKAQAHASAVLEKRAKERVKSKPGSKKAALDKTLSEAEVTAANDDPTQDSGSTAYSDAIAQTDAAEAALPVGAQTGTLQAVLDAGSPAPDADGAAQSPRELLIRDALAARKKHEAEWDALTPAQKDRAIAGLGEGMAAIVKTFRAA